MVLSALPHKRLALVAGAAVAAVPLVLVTQTGAATGSSAGSRASTDLTFTLVEHSGTFHFVDLPPRQQKPNTASVGDEVIFVNPLTKNGQKAGRVEAVCVFTRGPQTPRPQAICNGAFHLRGGQLTAAAGVTFTDQTVRIAITGGTGRYEGATGQVTSVTKSDRISVDTFHVILP